MSFISRLFGSKDQTPSPSQGRLTQRLEKLEAEAEKAAPGYVGTSYNRAGDVALRSGDQDRAVGYYGRAIDAFLEDGQREAARGVANKIIRVRPSAVRTLCTLTWLDLAAKHSATALLHLRDYVEAAKDVDERALAANQIFEMARIVPDSEFLGAVADALDSLAFPKKAEKVRAWAGDEGSPDALTDQDELSSACLRSAINSNVRGSG
jgi:tetratricopeptide (TPR) repeat protein